MIVALRSIFPAGGSARIRLSEIRSGLTLEQEKRVPRNAIGVAISPQDRLAGSSVGSHSAMDHLVRVLTLQGRRHGNSIYARFGLFAKLVCSAVKVTSDCGDDGSIVRDASPRRKCLGRD